MLTGLVDTQEIRIEAVKKVRPWGVDVCSGVELKPGIKDMKKVESFVNLLRNKLN